ncbi:N/A [soil metagenome]
MAAKHVFEGNRFLVLLNGARDHRPFYLRLGAQLEACGGSVHYALDSHLTDYTERGADVPSGRAHYFSESFQANYGREDLPASLRDVSVARLLAPDVDRWRYSSFAKRDDPRYIHTLIACLGHFFEDLFVEHAFDHVIYENVSNTFAYAAFEVARRHHAQYIGFVSSRLPGRTDVIGGTQSCAQHVERIYHRLRRGEVRPSADIREWVRRYIPASGRPDYMSATGPFLLGPVAKYLRPIAFRRAFETLRYGLEQPRDAYHSFQLTNPLTAHAEQLQKELFRSARKPLVRALYYGEPPSDGLPFILYPTQFHPESSTSVDAMGFEDELTNIRGIAANLPHRMRLVVRDHPLACARQPLYFYEQIRRLPNVDMTGPDVDYESLLRRCDAVVCASSSVGYDALLRGKPVFLLGRPFYAFVRGCTLLTGFGDLSARLAAKNRALPSPKDIEHFVTAYYMASVPSMFDVDRQVFRPGAEQIAIDAIARYGEDARHDAGVAGPVAMPS